MKYFIPIISYFFLLLSAGTSLAHFGMLIPARPVVSQVNKNLHLTLSFSHPFAGTGMDLNKPDRFFMTNGNATTNLLSLLKPASVMEHKAWQIDLSIKRPGVYWFVMQPAPYWEQSEDIFIVHYTKTVVPAFGADDNWDRPLGLATEIIPLTRPFGNYQGNSFTGQVLLHGKPVAGTDVEVEYYNQDHQIKARTDSHITQQVKTDKNGYFTFTCPLTGWWGFAALNTAEKTLKGPDGQEKEVEIGAVLWIYFDAYSRQ